MCGQTLIAMPVHATPLTRRRALAEGARLLARAAIESARLDAEVLLRYVLGVQRERFYVELEGPLSARERRLFHEALRRRARMEPVAYITGRREFRSLDFLVTRDVLIPRPETELLVETALELCGRLETDSALKVLDLGTGSGVIAVCLAKEKTDAAVWATDISAAALEVARINAVRHGLEGKILWLEGDLFAPVAARRDFFHLIVVNPPYVRRTDLNDLAPEVRDWEPRAALDGGVEGLDYYRRIAAEADRYLKDGGFLALEIGADMGEEVSRLFAAARWCTSATVYQDSAGRDRVVAAKKS